MKRFNWNDFSPIFVISKPYYVINRNEVYRNLHNLSYVELSYIFPQYLIDFLIEKSYKEEKNIKFPEWYP